MIRNVTALIFAAALVASPLASAQTPATTPPAAHPSTAAPAATGASQPPAAATTTSRSATTGRSAAAAKGKQTQQLATDQFTTEPAAKASCADDVVVWANIRSKVYHMSGTRYYGKTSRGAYMCQKAANSDGYHVSTGG